MLDLRIKQGRRHVPLFDLPAYMGRAAAAQELGDTIEGLVAFLDELDGDPDLEADKSDFEPDADGMGDPAWCEWHTLPAPTRKSGKLNSKPVDEWRGNILEDEEVDDVPEDDDPDAEHCGREPDDGY